MRRIRARVSRAAPALAGGAARVGEPGRSRRIAAAAAAGVIGALLCAAPAAAEQGDILVKPVAGSSAPERAALRADAGVDLVRSLPVPGVELVHPAAGDTGDALAALRADPAVAWAEADQPRRAATADPLFPLQWGLENLGGSVFGAPAAAGADIHAPAAWTVTRGAGVTVAIVDSGVDGGHPDLAGRLLPGWDFVEGDGSPDDANGHGTHVAGTVAATADETGVTGVAPEASILPLRVLDANGNGWSSNVAAAFERAAAQGARIVNASLGAGTITLAERAAIRNHPDTLFVVAAGNGGGDTAGDDVDVVREFPCALPDANVFCVGASAPDDTRAPFSNYGRTTVDLFAPGVRIVSDYLRTASSHLDPGYEVLDGTSMSTAFVAGAAALVAATRPGARAADIAAALIASADTPPALAGQSVGGGRLDAAGAVGVSQPGAAAPAGTPAPASSGDAQQPAPAPDPAAPPVAPGPAPLPPAARPAAAAPRLSNVRLSRAVVRCAKRCRPAILRFDLAAAGTVSATLDRRRCAGGRCRYRRAGRARLALGAGRHVLRVGPRFAGVRLRRGRWRVTLRTSAGTAVVVFRVTGRA